MVWVSKRSIWKGLSPAREQRSADICDSIDAQVGGDSTHA